MLGVTRAKAAMRRGAIRRSLRLLAAFMPALAIAVGQPMTQPAVVAADAPGCATTTASAYTVQLCFAQSLVGATLSGNAAVQANLTVQSGSYSVRWLVYTIDGAPLLNAYRAPYSFTLPTAQWADGPHILAVYTESLVAGNPCCTTSSASISVTFANGQLLAPTNTSQPTISLGTSPAPGSPEIVAAAGDGASGESTATGVANLISSWSPNLFLYLGDVYFQGTYTEFTNWYDGTFGRFRAISDPTIGNHEYLTTNGAGYFNYWNNEPHYYSYDAAGWHFISLDANQPAMSAAAWNNQLSWLQTDLAAHAGACTLAYWHQPLFNIGQEGPAAQTQAFWSALSAAHASIVVNGHDHNYQRWQPMDAAGNVSASGVTEFVAGTAGHGTTPFITTDTRMAAGTAAATSIGALKLSLSPASAAFQFVQSNGTVFDSGTVRCQGSGTLAGTVTDVQSSHPLAGAVVTYDGSASGLGSGSATTDGSGHYSVAALAAGTYAVSVSATGEASQTAAVTVGGAATSVHDFGLTGNPGRITGTVTDSNTGATVAGATVSFSGGSATTDATGNYAFAGVPPGSYTVTANATGYGTATHTAGVVAGSTTTQNLSLGPLPFTDDFESGGVSHWTTNTGLVPEQSTVHVGAWAIEGNATNGQTFASKNLPTNYQSVYYRTYLDLKSNSSNVSLLWDRTAAGVALLHLYVDSTGKLGLRNDITGVATIAPVVVSRGTWHSLEMHVTVNGTSSGIEVWLDGVHVTALESSAANLGTVLIGRVWLGENNIARIYDIAFDDVVIGASYVGP